MALSLPRFIVLESIDKRDFLSYIRDGAAGDGYLQFSEITQAVNPYARFEVELTRTTGVVHIRSCQNNKYWERTKNPSLDSNWITATANNKDDDEHTDSSTLFKFIPVDPAMDTVRIMHLQSQCYLCLWRWDNPPFSRCVRSDYTHHDGNSCDIFRIIDWSSLLILPRFVAFKGDNGKYLALRLLGGGLPYLQFSGTEISDPDVAYEIFHTADGEVRIKQISSNKFWKQNENNNWILADTDEGSSNTMGLFRPVKISDNTIGLISTKSLYLKRFTDELTSCLYAQYPSLTREAWLTVEEPVLRREIDGFSYDFDDARIYDETILVATEGFADNTTAIASEMVVKLKYTETRYMTWKANFSLKLGVKATVSVGIPIIASARVQSSGEVQAGVQWEKTVTRTIIVEDEYKVIVPPMTRAKIQVVATQGRCDVPFSFMQKDTLYNGTTVTTAILGGSFTGANYYNVKIVETNEPL